MKKREKIKIKEKKKKKGKKGKKKKGGPAGVHKNQVFWFATSPTLGAVLPLQSTSWNTSEFNFGFHGVGSKSSSSHGLTTVIGVLKMA